MLGPGWFIGTVQADVPIDDPELIEDGQVFAIYNPASDPTPCHPREPRPGLAGRSYGRSAVRSTLLALRGLADSCGERASVRMSRSLGARRCESYGAGVTESPLARRSQPRRTVGPLGVRRGHATHLQRHR